MFLLTCSFSLFTSTWYIAAISLSSITCKPRIVMIRDSILFAVREFGIAGEDRKNDPPWFACLRHSVNGGSKGVARNAPTPVPLPVSGSPNRVCKQMPDTPLKNHSQHKAKSLLGFWL